MNPDERRGGSGVDARAVKVATCGGDDAAHQQADDDGGRLHDGASEALAQDDGDEDGESQTDELGAAPGKCVRCVDGRAELEDARGRS